jgi:hypothetical protein
MSHATIPAASQNSAVIHSARHQMRPSCRPAKASGWLDETGAGEGVAATCFVTAAAAREGVPVMFYIS